MSKEGTYYEIKSHRVAHAYMEIRNKQNGEYEEVEFKLDTGSTFTIINSTELKTIGYSTEDLKDERVQAISYSGDSIGLSSLYAQEIEFGGLKFENSVALNSSSVERKHGCFPIFVNKNDNKGKENILGTDFLYYFDMELSWNNKRLMLKPNGLVNTGIASKQLKGIAHSDSVQSGLSDLSPSEYRAIRIINEFGGCIVKTEGDIYELVNVVLMKSDIESLIAKGYIKETQNTYILIDTKINAIQQEVLQYISYTE